MKQLHTYSFQVGPHLFKIMHSGGMQDILSLVPSLCPFVPQPAKEDLSSEALFSLSFFSEECATESVEYQLITEFEWEGASCSIYKEGNGDTATHRIVTLTPNDQEPYTAVCNRSFSECSISLHQTEADAFALNNLLMMLYAFNAAHHHTLLMHASVIVNEGKGYLFLGKSGTGKSTHTALWLKHIVGSYLLNDDNPIVHIDKDSGEITVFGSPWSGKTPCYINASAPIGAFVRLEQAPQNEIKRESAAHAFAALLPSCSCLKQDKQMHKALIDTVTQVVASTPVYHLRCLPDEAAAKVCMNAIK